MPLGENPTPVEEQHISSIPTIIEEQHFNDLNNITETVDTDSSPEEKLSGVNLKIRNEATQLSDQLNDYKNNITFKEDNGTITEIKNYSADGGNTLSFTLHNGDNPDENVFNFNINSKGELSVNGNNIPNEKAQEILNKLKANINEGIEYIKIQKENEKKEEIAKQLREKENEIAEADALIAQIDF